MKDYENNKVENYYKCPHCNYEWGDVWDSGCEDDCPECETRHITPYKSVNLKTGEII